MAKLKRLLVITQRQLFLFVAAAFVVTIVSIALMQGLLTRTTTTKLLELNINDVCQDIQDASDDNILRIAHMLARWVEEYGMVSSSDMEVLAKEYDVAEVNLVNADGIIVASNCPDFLDYDMRSGSQSAAFMCLLDSCPEFVQGFQSLSYDESISRKYAGVALKEGGFVQVGYDAGQLQQDIALQVRDASRNRHVGSSGYVIITDQAGTIVSDQHGNCGKNLSEISSVSMDSLPVPEMTRFPLTIMGTRVYGMYRQIEGYCILVNISHKECITGRNIALAANIISTLLIFLVMFFNIYLLLKYRVVKSIHKINDSLHNISSGNLSEVVDVRDSIEFDNLSNDINTTVDTLKQYISDAEQRIDKELEFARNIQHSALPCVFPPFPDRTDIDIFAHMDTAKEVGGDFYDFYFVGHNKLAIVIADVSGKGIPAALFMMRAKTTIKGFTGSQLSVAQVAYKVNNRLCEGNDANMFVTAWFGVVDLSTGELQYVNAGHNAPIIRRADGSTIFLRSQSDLVLAACENVEYVEHQVHLDEGDTLFLYTDGVTESTNEQFQLYGDDRLLQFVASLPSDVTATDLCKSVRESVSDFSGSADQFDDITMLALRRPSAKGN